MLSCQVQRVNELQWPLGWEEMHRPAFDSFEPFLGKRAKRNGFLMQFSGSGPRQNRENPAAQDGDGLGEAEVFEVGPGLRVIIVSPPSGRWQGSEAQPQCPGSVQRGGLLDGLTSPEYRFAHSPGRVMRRRGFSALGCTAIRCGTDQISMVSSRGCTSTSLSAYVYSVKR